jgi:hypothetical protein
VLETLWGDESLDLGSFGVWLFAFTLWLNFSSNDKFANRGLARVHCIVSHIDFRSLPGIIFLIKTKESSDFGSTLGAESLWLDNISQTWDVAIALLDNGKCEHR